VNLSSGLRGRLCPLSTEHNTLCNVTLLPIATCGLCLQLHGHAEIPRNPNKPSTEVTALHCIDSQQEIISATRRSGRGSAGGTHASKVPKCASHSHLYSPWLLIRRPDTSLSFLFLQIFDRFTGVCSLGGRASC
jgi:hypothetical protein